MEGGSKAHQRESGNQRLTGLPGQKSKETETAGRFRHKVGKFPHRLHHQEKKMTDRYRTMAMREHTRCKNIKSNWVNKRKGMMDLTQVRNAERKRAPFFVF